MLRFIIRQVAFSLAIIALALPFLAAAPARALDARTWVSGSGDNGNPCSRTAPCRTFAGALAKTAPGGEINCLDAGDFGPATIHFSLTISCEAGTAGVQATADISAGIFITAAATDVVTLRGLDIDGQGIGDSGIAIFSAKAVHVEKCTIRNFRLSGSSAGITTQNAFTIFLFVSNTVIFDNSKGVLLSSAGGFKVASLKNVTITGSSGHGLQLGSSDMFVNVTKSVISGNGGSAVRAFGHANIDRSTIANNAVALDVFGRSTIISISGNNIYNNTTGFLITTGATIQTDNTNNTGGSNGGGGVPNGTLTKN